MRAGEEIERVAIVRGTDADGGNYAVAATPYNVYVFAMSGASKVDGVRTRIPIRKATVERRASFLTVGRRGAAKPEHVFSTLPGGAPRRLESYVNEWRG